MITGFALIRFMSKDDYATFTLVLAIQGTTAVLVDLGFSNGLVALIGNRCEEPSVVGRYIGAAKYYRNRLISIGSVCLALVFMIASHRYEWGFTLGGVFWALVVASLWFDAQASFYYPILALKQRIKEIYIIDVGVAVLRLILVAGGYLLNLISAPMVLCLGVLQSITVASALRQSTKSDVEMPAVDATLTVERREALDLTLPKIPGAVFYAFQGQVTIFLISIFGQYTQIAELGALGKIGMLFMIPGTFANLLLVPWFAKLSRARVLTAYYGMLVLYGLLGLLLITLTWLWPQLFLFFLGSGYNTLTTEILLFAVSSALGLLSGLGYGLTSSRKWVYYWGGPTAISIYIAMLVLFIVYIDLSSIHNVIMLSILNSVSLILINQAVFWVGYLRQRQ